MNKILSLALLLCIPTAYSMEKLQKTHDAMLSIFKDLIIYVDNKSLDTNQKPQLNTRTLNTGSGAVQMMGCVSLPENNKYTHNQNGLWHTIKRNHHLQYVSKDFKSVFWNYFKTNPTFTLEEKNELICTLLRKWNQGNFHTIYITFKPMPPIADIALHLGADLYPILRGSIVTTQSCNPEFVRTIIDSEKSEVINEANDNGYTSLCYAIVYADFSRENKNGHIKIVKLLLTHPNIQVNPLDKQKCPLFWATYHCNIKVIKLLLAHPNIDVNAIDSYGSREETALFAAVNASWVHISFFEYVINLLLDAGADHTIKNSKDQTALDVARSNTYTANKAEVLEQVLAMKARKTIRLY